MKNTKKNQEIFVESIKHIDSFFKLSAHIGNKKWHPTMSSNLIASRNAVYILDISKTIKGLFNALDVISSIVSQKGHILFINSNPLYNKLLQKTCELTEQSYVNNRWVGGTLTNWPIISKEIETYKKVVTQLHLYTSLFYVSTPRYEKMKKSFQGFQTPISKPDLLIVLNPSKNKEAINEAWVLNIPVIAIVDSDTNLSKITYPIPGNNSSYEFIYYCLNIIVKTITNKYNTSVRD
uniref:Ribosomal protein S2 n=1 Tax=Nephroselmis olivacea TaxID=31312 RepID=Q9TCC3_NEPOL|nr:ribosomal protein S2 [Nephroselmis olivacea]AAF03174.1 ribosomal protein S2 [Nephroselmis olivacea]